ncbi:UNVERIFIED_CONTAM: hypothetical protein H355_005406 [Colinus virginianus]|nr:hypothetical protein H355_005406 [Colinus virginianus]
MVEKKLGNVNVASALVSLQETTESMEKTVNVMIGSVKVLMAMSVGVPATVESASVHHRNGTFRVIFVNVMTEIATNTMVSFAQVRDIAMLDKGSSGNQITLSGRLKYMTIFDMT